MIVEKIVVVSRESEIHQITHRLGHQVLIADEPSEALDIIRTTSPDLVLFHYRHSTDSFRDFMQKGSQFLVNTPVIVVSNETDLDNNTGQAFISMGAQNFLQLKDNSNLLRNIINQININPQTNKNDAKLSEQYSSHFFVDEFAEQIGMVGKSRAILDYLKMIKLIAASKCNPVLILGETGTGKEVAAKAIHFLRHPDEKLVAINCAALTSSLLESELFGHVKGAFTGADYDKTGLLELADNGTIFLDEISEMPIQLQAKLLRVLEEKQFRKVGGTKVISCNATIIAASNRNLIEEIRENRFRRDLYYRLNISPIILAPLRASERKADISLMAEFFLSRSVICPAKTNKITAFTSLAVEALTRHDWPGNVRELRNVVERAILLETTDKIGLSEIVFDPVEFIAKAQRPTTGDKTDFSLEKAERELISRALQQTDWQKTRAADLLGITRATLYAKLKQYNIEKQSGDTSCPTYQPDDNFAVSYT
jgi:DNA-binding NtrC family response regulator